MQLAEEFEKNKLFELPPNARDIAIDLLNTQSLAQLLNLRDQPDLKALATEHLPQEIWPDIIKATLLAKATMLLPNPQFNSAEILYLIKIACQAADWPLENYTLANIMSLASQDLPHFKHWLSKMITLLQSKTPTAKHKPQK